MKMNPEKLTGNEMYSVYNTHCEGRVLLHLPKIIGKNTPSQARPLNVRNTTSRV
jgi:hypothetical protein